MRVGKKLNILDTKKTRSCVVRLEKLPYKSSPTPSPPIRKSLNTQDHIRRGVGPVKRRSDPSLTGSSTGVTPKLVASVTPSREGSNIKGAPGKRAVGDGNDISTPKVLLQKQQAANISAMRSNQKVKLISRTNKTFSPRTVTAKASTPVRDETPTPTIASGRSRRAIKPNPKYASEDMVTPKMVRNVAGAANSWKTASEVDGKHRKNSTSSDDFYNRNSEGEADSQNEYTKGDKAYRVDEKEEEALDSDISDIEEEIAKRSPRGRLKGRKSDLSAKQGQNSIKTPTQTPNANIKRLFTKPGSTGRNAPSHLQQLRRSLQSANTQRNQSFLAGSSVAHKRKLVDPNDSDSDNSYTVASKQMLVTTSSGLKVRMPVKENSSQGTSQTNKIQRPLHGQKMSNSIEGRTQVNSENKNHTQPQFIAKRRIIDPSKITQQDTPNSKMVMRTLVNRQGQQTPANNNRSVISNKSITQAAQTGQQKSSMGMANATNALNRTRTSSPKPLGRKESTSSTSKLLTSITPKSSPPSTNAHQQQQKKLPTKPIEKLKSALASTISPATNSQQSKQSSQKNNQTTTETSTPIATAATAQNVVSINDDSPNSTMDDFETMPTFTIVNVNDIINKKGDVLITKSKNDTEETDQPTVLEFTDSITLDDDEDDDGDDEDEDRNDAKMQKGRSNKREVYPKKDNKSPSAKISKGVDGDKRKLPVNRNTNTDNTRRQQQSTNVASTLPPANSKATASSNKPQILNHKIGLRNNARVSSKNSAPLPTTNQKPAPRILNSVVAKKTQPVKPMITNLDDSAEESFPLSLDEEESDDETEVKSFEPRREQPKRNVKMPLALDATEVTDSEISETEEVPKTLSPKNNSKSTLETSSKSTSPVQRKKRLPNTRNSPTIVTNNKKRVLTPTAAKENSLAATNVQASDQKSPSVDITPPLRKQPVEKVVISKQGDKIIKKITCFETWYVINIPLEPQKQPPVKNQLDLPLINLANNAQCIHLPSDLWSCKVTLYELSATTLAKSTFVTYTGSLEEYNINEEDRAKYQPSCVMFRRSIENREQSRMPYDRAVIFKNKTFSTNIDGKNIRLVGAPSIINSEKDIEILLDVVDGLTLQSEFIENAAFIQ
ncbi:uncharacterized protein LOC142228459 [Haematobia irritans]|uniref:uncharacterized protein LOC142228459 n=1 Tax=Haematobia irritans TaxID=7368 RepID=UPI003F4FACD4